jgi:hypothetical protein
MCSQSWSGAPAVHRLAICPGGVVGKCTVDEHLPRLAVTDYLLDLPGEDETVDRWVQPSLSWECVERVVVERASLTSTAK